MNRKAIADAANKISEGFMEFALAIEQSEAGGATVAPPQPSPAPTAPPQNTALGKCPKHGVPWRAKPPGTSRNGNPYPAFWSCPEKDESEQRGYCQQKPDKGWAKTHPPEQALVGDTDDVPF